MSVKDIFMHHFALIFSKTRNLMLEISSKREKEHLKIISYLLELPISNHLPINPNKFVNINQMRTTSSKSLTALRCLWQAFYKPHEALKLYF